MRGNFAPHPEPFGPGGPSRASLLRKRISSTPSAHGRRGGETHSRKRRVNDIQRPRGAHSGMAAMRVSVAVEARLAQWPHPSPSHALPRPLPVAIEFHQCHRPLGMTDAQTAGPPSLKTAQNKDSGSKSASPSLKQPDFKDSDTADFSGEAAMAPSGAATERQRDFRRKSKQRSRRRLRSNRRIPPERGMSR